MSRFTDLAEILEQSAKALREADECLAKGFPKYADIAPVRPIMDEIRGALSVRLRKAIARTENGIRIDTIDDLCNQTASQLMKRRGVGIGGINELRKWLGSKGRRLSGE